MAKIAINVDLWREHEQWLMDHGVQIPTNETNFWYSWLNNNRENPILFECIETFSELRREADIIEYNENWFSAKRKICLPHPEKLQLIPHDPIATIGELIENQDLDNLLKFLIAWRSSELWNAGQTYICAGNEKTTEYHWIPYLRYNYECNDWTIIALKAIITDIIENNTRNDAIDSILKLVEEGMHF